MNIADVVDAMVGAGCSPDQIATATRLLATTPRQATNSRYYQANKERLKNRLKPSEIKTSEIKTIKTDSDTIQTFSDPSRVEDKLLPLESTGKIPSLSEASLPPDFKKIDRAESDEKLLDQIIDIWNPFAKKHGLSQVKFLTKTRGQHCRRRLADITNGQGPIKAFESLLVCCERSFFIRGSPRSPLKFDQLMNEGFMVKMLEGSFEHGQASGQSARFGAAR